MKENDISKMLPDWTLTYVLSENGNEKIYQAEKESGGLVKYSLIRAVFLPCKDEDFDSHSVKSDDINDGNQIVEMLNKCKREFAFLRSMSSKRGWLSLKESYDLLNTKNNRALAVARFGCAIKLSDFVKENGMTEGAVLKLGIDICRGLEHAKKIDALHGTLSPDVIFVDENCKFKIGKIDIDVSQNRKLSDKNTGSLDFTAPYAPKQGLDFSCDTYSVGLIMYYYLNGKKLPFEDELSRSEATKKRLSGEKFGNPLYDSERITKIVMKACSPEKADRYQSPYALRKELEEVYFRIQKELEEKKIKERMAQKSAEDSQSAQKDISAVREHEKDEEEIRTEKSNKRKSLATFASVVLIIIAAAAAVITPKIISKIKYKDLSRYKIHLASVYYKDTDKAGDYEFNYYYDGTQKKPGIVIDKHEKLIEGTDYTVEYKNNVEIGKATIIVKGIGSYKGEKKRTFKITPEDPGDIESFEAEKIGADNAVLSWSESERADRYLIYFADDSQKWGKPVYILDSSVTSMKLTGLEPDKEYFLKINGAVAFGNNQTKKGTGTTVKFKTSAE